MVAMDEGSIMVLLTVATELALSLAVGISL